MKLVHKFVGIYLLIALAVFSAGGIISFNFLQNLLNQETDYELRRQVRQLARLIEKGIPHDSLESSKIQILQLNDTIGLKPSKSYSDTLAYHHPAHDTIVNRKLTNIIKAGGNWYKVEIFNTFVEPEDSMEGTFKIVSMLFLLLVVVSLVLSFFVSRWLLKPFHFSLKTIESFDLGDEKGTNLPKSKTQEFNQFNEFINSMTEKASRDYKSLREFSENAAHEIRTPLAVASSKMDLLLQTNDLRKEQIDLISEAQQSLKKLSKIQHSLSLLSKIDNNEFSNEQEIQFDQLINDIIRDHEDIMGFKKLGLVKNIESNVSISGDPVLMEILVSNLIQNAIRHNLDDGEVNINLSQNQLVVSNTGESLQIKSSELFERFKKNNQSQESIGLGLSIVKKIVDISGFDIKYAFDTDKKHHQFSLSW